MEGHQKPDSPPENEKSADDVEVIELTQVVNGVDDDDIIDLTDILERSDRAPDTANEPYEQTADLVQEAEEEGDEEILELTDVASTSEPVADIASAFDEEALPDETDDADEAAIELTDVAIPTEADIAGPGTDVPAEQPEEEVQAADEDETVIDLLDVAAEMPEIDVALADAADDAEDVIDLVDTVEPDSAAIEDIDLADLDNGLEDIFTDHGDTGGESDLEILEIDTPEEAVPNVGPDDDFVVLADEQATDADEASTDAADMAETALEIPEPSAQALPAEADAEPEMAAQAPDAVEPFAAEEAVFAEPEPLAAVPVTPPIPSAPAEAVALTDAQVQAALERVIEKIYGARIEQLMIQTIEKTVKREIEKIKNALLEDSGGALD